MVLEDWFDCCVLESFCILEKVQLSNCWALSGAKWQLWTKIHLIKGVSMLEEFLVLMREMDFNFTVVQLKVDDKTVNVRIVEEFTI